MSSRPALHDNQVLKPIPPIGGCRQPEDGLDGHAFHDRLKIEGRHVMALIHDQQAVLAVEGIVPGKIPQRLDHREINAPRTSASTPLGSTSEPGSSS